MVFGNDQEPFSCTKRNKAGKEFEESRELTNANNILGSNKTEWPTNQPNENIMQRKNNTKHKKHGCQDYSNHCQVNKLL